MMLAFPNAVRSYSVGKRCVSFWGHDTSVEIAFEVDVDALQRMSQDTSLDEDLLLRTFETNRERIERAAGAAYARRRMTYLRLSPADF